MVKSKIKLNRNIPLTDHEFDEVRILCDLANALCQCRKAFLEANCMDPSIHMPSGLEWGSVGTWGGSWQELKAKNRKSIDVFKCMGNVFSDRPIVQYNSDELTPDLDASVKRTIMMMKALPKKWRHYMPSRFGEIGWDFNGYPINCQTETHQERFAALFLSGVADWLSNKSETSEPPKILEVGAGSGEALYTFCKALPGATVYNCDLPECQSHAMTLLRTLLPEKRHYVYTSNLDLVLPSQNTFSINDREDVLNLQNSVVHIPNYLIGDFNNLLTVDLVYNAWSFSEMSEKQVEHYAMLICSFIGKIGILFEQNGNHAEKGGNYCKDTFKNFFKFRSSEILAGPYDARALGGEIDIWSANKVDLPTLATKKKIRVLKSMEEIPGRQPWNTAAILEKDILGHWLKHC